MRLSRIIGAPVFPYWLLFALFSAGALQHGRSPSDVQARVQRPAPLLLFAGVVTALLIGFRYEVGADWFTYEEIFGVISFMDLFEALAYDDPGYALLNWIAVGLEVEIWFVNFACALIFCWGLIRFARAQPNPWLALVVAAPYLILVVSMGYTRQAVAIGIVLAGLSRIGQVPIYRFSLYIVAATTFHKTAIIVLPLVALTETRNRYLTAAMMGIIAIFLYFQFVDEALDRMMTNYVEAEYSSQGAAIRVGMNLPPAVLFILFMRRFSENEQERAVWRNMSLAAFAALILLLMSAASTAVDRSALYVIPLQIYVLSKLPFAFSRDGRPGILMVLLVIAYSAVIQFVWLNYATHAEYWLPYRIYPLFEQTIY